MDKTALKNEAKTRLADTAVKIIIDGKMLQEIAPVATFSHGRDRSAGKARAQKVPSDAIQRCFAGTDGKAVAGIVIARAKADGETGEKLRAALEEDGVNLTEWEEWINNAE